MLKFKLGRTRYLDVSLKVESNSWVIMPCRRRPDSHDDELRSPPRRQWERPADVAVGCGVCERPTFSRRSAVERPVPQVLARARRRCRRCAPRPLPERGGAPAFTSSTSQQQRKKKRKHVHQFDVQIAALKKARALLPHLPPRADDVNILSRKGTSLL